MKHSELISFFFKNKNEKKQNSVENRQTMQEEKSCYKIK